MHITSLKKGHQYSYRSNFPKTLQPCAIVNPNSHMPCPRIKQDREPWLSTNHAALLNIIVVAVCTLAILLLNSLNKDQSLFWHEKKQ